MIRMSTVGIIVGVGLTSVCLYGIYLVEKAHKLYEENLSKEDVEKKAKEDILTQELFIEHLEHLSNSETRHLGVEYFERRMLEETEQEKIEVIRNLLKNAHRAAKREKLVEVSSKINR